MAWEKDKKTVLVSLNPFPNNPSFLHVCSTSLKKNTVGKEEIARNEPFLLFPQCFLPICRILTILSNLKSLSSNTLSLEESKICHLGKG